jgi:hypothetical protein
MSSPAASFGDGTSAGWECPIDLNASSVEASAAASPLITFGPESIPVTPPVTFSGEQAQFVEPEEDVDLATECAQQPNKYFFTECSLQAVPEKDNTDSEVGVDKPGLYVILRATNVSKELANSSAFVRRLAVGTEVDVIEVVKETKRLRAKIRDPEGWMSLLNLEDDTRWACLKTDASLARRESLEAYEEKDATAQESADNEPEF